MSHPENDVLATAEAWRKAGRAVAIATVVETWGSAPRPVGSHLIVDSGGNFEGSVSGGCVEGEVVTEAIDVIGKGAPRTLEFGVADETAWRVGLSCGGRIRVYVEKLVEEGPGRVDLALLERLNAARARREAAVLVTDMATGSVRLVVEKDGYDGDPLAPELARRFRSGVSGSVPVVDGGSVFLTVHLPPPRLIVIGAVHISQALAPMAGIAGFDMVIVDPRQAFATPERFPDVVLIAEWPKVALPRLGLDAFTAVAALSHDPKIDDHALIAALAAGCFYVGALGSRKTHAKRLERLAALGLDTETLGRIHAPIGLGIGAQSPAEIAVSILAELILALRHRCAA